MSCPKHSSVDLWKAPTVPLVIWVWNEGKAVGGANLELRDHQPSAWYLRTLNKVLGAQKALLVASRIHCFPTEYWIVPLFFWHFLYSLLRQCKSCYARYASSLHSVHANSVNVTETATDIKPNDRDRVPYELWGHFV